MKNIKKLVATAIIGTMAFSFAGCSLVQKTDEAINATVLATVGDAEVTLGEVDEVLEQDIAYLKEQFGEDFEENLDPETANALKEARTQVIEMLVENEMMLQEGEKMGILPLEQATIDEAVEEEIQRLIELYEGEEGFQEQLKAAGFTEESYRETLVEQVDMIKVIEEITKGVEVSDEEVQKYYDENKNTFVKEAGKAKTRHLLFKTEEEAKVASEKIVSGETTFSALFTEYTENKAKAAAEGASEEDKALPISEDLGEVSHTEQNYDPLFLQGLLPLAEGQVSAPIKSSFGYHIIEATGVTATTLSTFDEVKENIKEYLTKAEEEKIYTEKVTELKKEYEIKTYENRL